MTLTTIQAEARDLLVKEKQEALEEWKSEQAKAQKQFEELIDFDTKLKFYIENAEREIKALKEMK